MGFRRHGLTGSLNVVELSGRRGTEVFDELDEIRKDDLQTTVDVDLSVLNSLEVLDESVDVGLDGLDLVRGESQERAQDVKERVEGSLQLQQEGVKLGRRLVG